MKPAIVFVHAFGGPPIDYVMPVLARRCSVHALLLSTASPYNRAIIQQFAQTVTERSDVPAAPVVDWIVNHARSVGASAVITFSEYLVVAVAEACEQLGLRGAGPNAVLARNKLAMRTRWAEAGIQVPEFHAVRSKSDLHDAARRLNGPFVLKDAWGAGAIGTQSVVPGSDLDAAFDRTQAAVADARQHLIRERSAYGDCPIQLIAEALMEGASVDWFTDAERGDFVSVEGVVVDGVPQSLALAGRMRPLPPFCETADLLPSTIDANTQARLFDLANEAVRALGLQNCATHTEFKLMSGRSVGLLEVAARVGGTAIARQVHATQGLCLVDHLLTALLGTELETSTQSFSQPVASATAGLQVIGADMRGRPWREALAFDHRRIDWTEWLGPEVDVRLERSLSPPAGTWVTPYDPSRGVLNAASVLLVTAPDASRLLGACQQIVNGLENKLLAAATSCDTP
jgi:biotin carboxylase